MTPITRIDRRTSGESAIALAITVSLALSGCGDDGSSVGPPADPGILAGGDTTVFTATSNAFSFPAPNLTPDAFDLHMRGDVTFEETFVTAPAVVNGGLGPVFNESSCLACHPRDGRGRPPEDGETIGAMLLKTSIGNDEVTGPVATPGFGTQLQHRAIFGVEPEVTIRVTYEEHEEQFADGSVITLRRPRYRVVGSYVEFPRDAELSPRIGPPVFGRGLLEAVPDDALLALADPEDRDGDGVSGRVNRVWDAVHQAVAIGRFGVKAGNPTLLQQAAGAYVEDMGVTNRVFSSDPCVGQPQDDGLSDDPELPDEKLDATVFYVQTLGVPARRNVDDPEVQRGREVFYEVGCVGCHTPQLRTSSRTGVDAVSNQVIWPYTDLLLHDMGDGLADRRPDFAASGREWRTPPLWGVGLTKTVQGHDFLLHDGRARGLLEAVMWHGGEAESSREKVRQLETDDRVALIRFLESL